MPISIQWSELLVMTAVLGCLSAVGCAQSAGSLRLTDLRCEYLVNPQGIDTPTPRLSWYLAPSDPALRSLKQTAYQILVASSQAMLDQNRPDLWDTGIVRSDQSIHIPYGGTQLASGTRCFWKARALDREGIPSPWSETATFSVGLLQPTDWKAQWIGLDVPDPLSAPENTRLPARMLRREFPLEKRVQRATAYICGLGLYELYVNGKKIGDHVLDPGLTDYSRRAFYVTYDITPQLTAGPNALGVILGNGRYFAPRTKVPTETRTYGYPKLLAQFHVEYADGSSELIVSDPSWKMTTNGPIRANNEYDGEEYDARLEQPGWASPGFDDSTWENAALVSGPGGRLSAQMLEPIRVTGTIKPAKMSSPKPGVYIFDLGQNIVGWCRLTVRGPAGASVQLRHAEILRPDGTLYLDNIRSAKVTDVYTLKGTGDESWEPRFVYHGFRYVEVTGFPGQPSLTSIEGRIVNSDVQPAGEFSCSNILINRIHQNILWGVRGNYRSFPTDCPQRDERQAWLGDRSAECKGESYLFGIASLYAKWIADIEDSQKDNGSVSDVCPAYWPFYSDNVTWPSTFIIAPGTLHEQYADLRVIEKHYPAMKKWIDHMSTFIKDDLIARDNYGDWCVPPESPTLIHSADPKRKTAGEVLATAYFCYDLQLMARYATLLQKPLDAKRFSEQAERMKTAFNKKYFKSDTATYDNGSQTSSVLPLAFGLVPPEHHARVFAALAEKIETTGHLGTGLIGGQWIMRVLSDNGRPDLAYTLASRRDYPSWGYMIDKGATTIWELWNGDTADPAMNSGNHVMLVGDLAIWFYEYVVGIRPDPDKPAFKHILVKPQPVGDLLHATATVKTMYGPVRAHWNIDNDRFTLTLSIPPNTTATVQLPPPYSNNTSLDGEPSTPKRHLGSGQYTFVGFHSRPQAN